MDPARATSLEPQWLEQGTVCHKGGTSMLFQDERKELVHWEETQEDVPCPRLEGRPGGFSIFSFLFIEIISF